MRSLETISNELAEVEKEIKNNILYVEKIDVEIMTISKQIAELQIKKKDLQIPQVQGKNLLKRYNIEHGALKREYFSFKI